MKKNILLSSITVLLLSQHVLGNEEKFQATIKTDLAKIREHANKDSEVIKTLDKESIIIINKCDKYGWCKLEEGGYIPGFLISAENLKTNYKSNFVKNQNSTATVKKDNTGIYQRPFAKAKIIGQLKKEEKVNILGCDDYGWCKLEKGGYIPSFLVKFNSFKNDTIKEKTIVKTITPKKKKYKKYKKNQVIAFYVMKKKKTLNVENIKKETIQENKVNTTISKKYDFIDEYKKALNYYKNKQYDKSYTILNKLSKNSNNENVNFYLGRSAYKTNKYNSALTAYNKVLEKKPNALRTRYEKAKTLYALNEKTKAKDIFNDLLKNDNLKPNTRNSIKKYLAKINEKKHFFYNALIAGVGYDSNVNNSSDDKVFKNVFIPVLNTNGNLTNTTKKEDDGFFELGLNTKHIYKINDNSLLSNNLLIYSNTMFKVNEKNLLYFSYNPAYEYFVNSKLSVNPSIFIGNLRQDNKNYLVHYGLNPKLKYKLNAKNSMQFEIKHEIKKFQEKINENKDSKVNELRFTNNNLLNKKNILALELKYAKEKKDQGNLIIDNQKYFIKLANKYLYNDKLSFTPSVSYTNIKFDDIHTNFMKKEETKKMNYELLTNYIYDKNLNLNFKVNYEKTNSNISISQYDKYGILLNIIRPF